MEKEYICVYDSGIGGLTTLSEIIKLKPNENYLYFADNKNCPYGNKSKKELTRLVIQNINEILQKFKIKMLIFACNTITAVSVNKVRRIYKFSIVGMEPAIKLAMENSGNKSIVAIMTKSTLRQKRYKNLVKQTSGNVCSVSFKNLANDIEQNKIFDKNINYEDYFTAIKDSITENNSDCLVLGCTHYIYLKQILEKQLKTKVYDGNKGVARRVSQLLENSFNNKEGGEVKFLLSFHDDNQIIKYEKILNSLKNY